MNTRIINRGKSILLVYTHSYSLPPTEHRLNSMTFFVRVPVLSVNMYLTIPSSSFRLLVRAIAGVFESGWYISMSMLMNVAWTNLTTSSVTCSDIGIKLLKRIINVSRLKAKFLVISSATRRRAKLEHPRDTSATRVCGCHIFTLQSQVPEALFVGVRPHDVEDRRKNAQQKKYEK